MCWLEVSVRDCASLLLCVWMYWRENVISPPILLIVLVSLLFFYQQLTYFRSCFSVGNVFLSKFQASLCDYPLLENITLLDTPGVLSGSKQSAGRGYDFIGVVGAMANKADRIILCFDAHKLDISDEFAKTIEALKGNEEKIKIVLNKADAVSQQELMRVYPFLLYYQGLTIVFSLSLSSLFSFFFKFLHLITYYLVLLLSFIFSFLLFFHPSFPLFSFFFFLSYGALMWSLGKVLSTPEVMRVYISSFWDQPFKNKKLERLFTKERTDLINVFNFFFFSFLFFPFLSDDARARTHTHTHILSLSHIHSLTHTLIHSPGLVVSPALRDRPPSERVGETCAPCACSRIHHRTDTRRDARSLREREKEKRDYRGFSLVYLFLFFSFPFLFSLLSFFEGNICKLIWKKNIYVMLIILSIYQREKRRKRNQYFFSNSSL